MAYTYSKLASSTVGVGGAATIAFNNIPQNYTDLVLKVSARGTAASISSGMFIQINGIAASYSARNLYGDGNAAASNTNPYSITSKLWAGSICGASATASTFGNGDVYIPNYTSTNNKSASVDGVVENNAATGYQNMAASLLSNITAISSFVLSLDSGSFAQYSTATLYGIRAEL